MTNMQKYLTVFMLIVAVGGVLLGWESRYAKADQVRMIEQRLDQKILQDRMESIQERMWKMEDKWAERFSIETGRIHDTLEELLHYMTPEARDQYRFLQYEYQELAKTLEGRSE